MVKRPLGVQISRMLKDRGVDVIFGIPGVHNIELYRGIEEAGITHVLARHEQGAGFMADGYARATGKPGVAYVISGPGLCNIMTPMGQAFSDSVPMLVISSCLDETAAKRGQLHQMKDQEAAARCVCDWSETARDAESAYQLIDRAFAEFRVKRARPKHIQLPIEVLGKAADPAQRLKFEPSRCNLPNAIITEHVASKLKKAARPLFILGGGARPATKALRQVIDWLGAAVFTTYAGRGIVEPGYALNFGSFLARPESESIIASADVVIAIGTELSEVDLWRDMLGVNGWFFHVDIDPISLSAQASSEFDDLICSESGQFVRAFSVHLRGHESVSQWTGEEVAETRARWRAEVDANRPGIVPLCDAMTEVLPPMTRVYSDMTQFAYVAKEVIDMAHPGLWHHPYGFGTLGYALPAAIGGKVGLPDYPVIAIAGDYGFHYTMQELGVAVELGLSLPIILWDNGKLKEIEDCMVNSQIAPNAVVARNPDFCKLAEAFGARSVKPASVSEFQNELVSSFEADGPTLIHLTPEVNR